MPTSADVAAALGQRSEAPQTDDPDPADPADGGDDPEGKEPADGADPAENPAPGDPDESEDPAAPKGDDAADEPGDPEDPESPGEQPDPAEAPAKPEAEKSEEKTATEKRFGELTARAKSAEEALAKTREQLAARDAEAAGRMKPGVLDHIDTLAQLGQQRSSLVRLHQWALTHPTGGELPNPDGKGEPITYDAEQVQQLLGETFALVHEAVPQREQFLRDRERSEAAAVDFYPWLKDTRTGAGAQVQAAIEAMPALRLLGPHYRTVAADGLVGQMLREAGIKVDGKLVERLKRELATAAKPGAKPGAPASLPRRLPPQAPARAGILPTRLGNRGAEAQAAGKRLSKGDGNVRDLAASIAAKLG